MQALALLIPFLLSGCSGDPYVTPPADEEGIFVIELTDANTFEPAKAKVPVGATVAWHVVGGSHDVSEEDGEWSSADEQPLDSQGYPLPMGPGDEYWRTFNETATYTLWCHIHHEQDMKMVLKVG